MAALDLLGRRWMLRVLWELRDGPRTFRVLRDGCDAVSPSVLNTRLAEMRAAGLVEARVDEGYALTPEGERLLEALAPLHAWARRWAAAAPASTGTRRSYVAAAGAAPPRRGARRPSRSR